MCCTFARTVKETAFSKRIKMGTADWTNEKFRSFYWEDQHRPARVHQYTRRTGGVPRLLGLTCCTPALWQLPIEAAGIQIKTDWLQVISWLQILVQALRSGGLIHHFHAKSLRQWHLNVFCATSTWLSDTFATWTQASLPFSNLSVQLSRLRNKEAGINISSAFHSPFIPLSFSLSLSLTFADYPFPLLFFSSRTVFHPPSGNGI